jgi:integrase
VIPQGRGRRGSGRIFLGTVKCQHQSGAEPDSFGCMTEPRLMSGSDAASYCGVAPATFSQWVAAGRMPGPLPGTRRWDRKAIDLALDEASDIAVRPGPQGDIGTTPIPVSTPPRQGPADGSRMPGLATASKGLADGSRRKYYYAWRGGPMLKARDGTTLQPGDPAFVVAYLGAHAERKKPAPGTLFSLIAAYKASSDFTGCAPRSRKDYLRFLKMIEDEFGAMPLAAVESRAARGDFKAWRDRMADNPRKADYAWGMLARVLAVAKDRGLISVNVCERGGRLYSVDRAEIIWQAEHIKAFCKVASDQLRFAIVLALWTAQRQGDLIRLRWSQYDGTQIRLKQGKRQARVAVPVGPVLKAALDARCPEEADGPILCNSRGQPWTGDGFRTSWGKAFDRANLDGTDLRFNDLRGTAVTRLALAGCTVPQIASLTGHSLKDVERILDAHYLGGKFELAEQAIVKLNAKYVHEAQIAFTNGESDPLCRQ